MSASSFVRCCALAVVSVSLIGCASTRPMPYRQLPSSSYLRPHDGSRGDRMPYAYHGDVDWSRYRTALVEPVSIYRGPDAQFEDVPEQDKRRLAELMQREFGDAIGQRWERTTTAQRDTLRVRITLTGAKPSKRVLGTFMKVDIGGGSYNAVQAARGKEGAFSGSVSYAVEIFDASAIACWRPMSKSNTPTQ
ncbi:Secreted protein (fragment) [Xanthomonas citri pv. fuscans]